MASTVWKNKLGKDPTLIIKTHLNLYPEGLRNECRRESVKKESRRKVEGQTL